MKTGLEELLEWVCETPPQTRHASLEVKIRDLIGKQKSSALTDEMIHTWARQSTEKHQGELFGGKITGAKWARDFITGEPESLKQQIINLSIGKRLDLLDEFCSYCGSIQSKDHNCAKENDYQTKL